MRDTRRHNLRNAALGAIAIGVSGGAASADGQPFFGFAPPQLVPAGQGPHAIALADFNNDGAPDLIVANFREDLVSICFGLGDGGFVSAVNLPVGQFPAALTTGDLDNDGAVDFVVTQNPAGNENDGVRVHRNLGDGTFEFLGFYPTGPSPESVQLVDLNQNGCLDLIVGVFNDVVVLPGDCAGGFERPRFLGVGSSFVVARAADVTLNGKPDIIAASFSASSVSVLRNLGGGELEDPLSFDSGPRPRSLAVGDVDGDGWPDIVVAGSTQDTFGAVSLLRGLGDGQFAPPVKLFSGSDTGMGVGAWDVMLADLNSDKAPDLIVSNEASGDIAVLINNGNGGFLEPMFFGVGASPRALAVGDINNSASLDLAVANFADDNVAVLLNLASNPIDLNADGVIDGADLAILLSEWGAASGPADLNGDGVVNGADLAILLANWTG